GGASRNVRAPAGCTPRAHSRPAIGTEAHSHPGRAVPARAALGTASTGDFGSSRARAAGDTSALVAPLTRTPRARKGRAWTTMATNTVVQVRSATGLSEPVTVPREYRATTTSSTISRPSTRRRGTPDATSCAASPRPSVDLMARHSRPPGQLPLQASIHERPARRRLHPAVRPGAQYYTSYRVSGLEATCPGICRRRER